MKRETVVPVPSPIKLECSSCGATTDAPCQCGKPYLPAGTRAAKAIEKNPERSDRSIAAELGVGSNTVRRARKAAAPSGAPGKRVGKDGKSYPAVLRLVPNPTSEPKTITIEYERGQDAISPPVTPLAHVLAQAAQSELDRWLTHHRNHLPDDVLAAAETLRRLLSAHTTPQ